MFEDILPRVSRYPFDSHGNVTLNIVAAIGALMVGDIPEADAWVREAVPAAIAWTSPWGWQDGLRPSPDAPVWRMSAFRDRFLTAFGPR